MEAVRSAPGAHALHQEVQVDNSGQDEVRVEDRERGLEAGYESRSDNCCFAGRELRGRVLITVARGAVAYRERGFAIRLAEEPGGTVAARERA